MTYRYSFAQLDQERSLLRDGVMSLKHYWRRSGGKWTRLKKLIIEHRGTHCEECGAGGVTLEAHEVWKHINAYGAGIEPKKIRQVMKGRRERFRKFNAAVQERYSAMGKPLPIHFKRSPRAFVRALVDIKLLCRECHGAAHGWDVDYHRDFIMESHYSGFDELPNFRTFAEWEAAMQDDAEALNEDERYYRRPYPGE